MAGEEFTDDCKGNSEKMPGESGKIQRTLSSMIKQMEMTDEEMRYRMENFENAEIGKQYLRHLKCTKCGLSFQNIINKGDAVGVHPLLGVLLCDSCCDYYGDGNFSMDSEGEDKYCRWCGQGGTIFACSKCICGFCEECIKKHFGRHGLENVKNDDDWVCYFCNPKPLWYLRSICSLAREAARNKKEQLEIMQEGRNSKKKIEDVQCSNSSDSCPNATDSVKKKKLKQKKVSRLKDKGKRDSSSSSDDDEKVLIVKMKRKSKKKSRQAPATEESSGSDEINPKKKAKIADDRNGDSNLDKIKTPLLTKLKSIWKLTYTTTDIGVRSCREKLLKLSKDNAFTSVESLKKEHEELKSCLSVMLSTLGVASNSANSIGDDLQFDTAKDEREIFQSQESKLKRFAKRFGVGSNFEETSFDTGRDGTLKAEEKRDEKEETEKERRRKEKSVVNSAEEGEGEEGEGADGSASGSEKRAEEDSDEGSASAKPLLKVKSFARMLDENAYDNQVDGASVNGECDASGENKMPVVIDLYDMDTDGSEREGKQKQKKKKKKKRRKRKKKKSVEDGDEDENEEEEGEESSENESKTSTAKKERNSSRKSKRSSIENGECDGREGNSDQREKCDGERKLRKRRSETNKKSESENDEKDERNETDEKEEARERVAEETVDQEADKSTENLDTTIDESDEEESEKTAETVEKKVDETVEEESEKETPSQEKKDSDSSSNSEDENKNPEEVEEKKEDETLPLDNETEKTDVKSPEEKSQEENAKADSASEDSSSSGEQKNLRVTRKKKKKQDLKVSFEEFKQKRQSFLKSGKEDTPPKTEGKKVSALDSSDSETERKEKSGKKKRVLTTSDEDSDGAAKVDGNSHEEESEQEKQKSDPEVKTPSETSSDEITSRQTKRKRIRRNKDSDSGEETKKKKKRRKGNNSNSSGEDSDKKNKGRRNIKKILKKDSLQVETKEALKNEQERKKRLKERQKLFEETFPEQKDYTQLKHLILDFDPDTKQPLVTVHKKLVKKLKPHQAMGVRFMWDNCFESVQRMEEDAGSGCILAHCMGLGKTLQVITLVHTVMTHDLGVNTVLIVCPLSTVANWLREFETWLGNINTDPITLYDIIKYKKPEDRRFYLKDWQESGGVLVTSYDMFRNLTKDFTRKKKSRSQKAFESALVDPGPDLVICDEGHLLKNEDTALSKCMARVKTSRRIILTGTPLQNNLIEYHCMVQFVKPNILGTKKEFMNRFVNPINNGQFEDSTELDVKIMKRRSHVLHSMLDGCIQRFDYSVLTPFLPEKHEYVLAIEVTDTQAKLYRHFLSNLSGKSAGSSRTASLFNDYHSLQKIWTHPRTMLMHSEKESSREEAESEGSLKDFIVSTDEESASSSSEASDGSVREAPPPKRITRSTANNPEVLEAMQKEEDAAAKNWWDDFYSEKAYDDLREGNKLVLLFALLKHCEKIKDKVLVFSQSLYSLDLIEYFLAKVNENRGQDDELLCGHRGSWVMGRDYFRLDGSTTSEKRANWCNYFNEPSNSRARLFLLSTKAGGLGINLYGANRVVIFDASWNPSHDLQSIFRVYRFGQKKTCYVYRFLSEATMEEKIYERQVTKLSLACRVVDEHQIERHYTMGNLQALYNFEPTPKDARKIPILPKDPVFADILAEHKDIIVGYHEHDSLLENKQEEELSEEERKAAWKEYEEEKVQKTYVFDPIAQQMMLMQQARLAQGGAPMPMLEMYLNPGNAGQVIINPMYLQANPNIPLPVHHRGLKVGLTPGVNETLESFFMRILKKEKLMVPAGQQQMQQSQSQSQPQPQKQQKKQ